MPRPRPTILTVTLLLCLCCLLARPLAHAHAQPDGPLLDTVAGEAEAIIYGTELDASIDDASPRRAWAFAGLRGERIAVQVRITSGNLVANLLLVSADGQIVASTQGSSMLELGGLRLPASGLYTLVLARFGGQTGTTRGDFTLTLDREGASAEDGSALRIGDQLIGEISNDVPRLFYTFRAGRGDVLTIQMRRLSGNLDARLQVTDSAGNVIAENDEILGSGSLDAAIDALVITQDGTYVIVASRFGGESGDSVGDFLLTLDTAANSALGTSALLAAPISPGAAVTGTLTGDRYAQFYRFEGRRDDVVSVRMARAGEGNLDTLLAITDAALNELAVNDDTEGSQNSAIENFVLPASGVYYIIATRYERAAGVTEGGFTLSFENSGSVFAEVPLGALRLTYGSTVGGYIDDITPETLYVFQGQAGDVITIAQTRADGTLDPLLTLLDSRLNVLVTDDDGAGQQNARIDRYTLPATGVYYIRAGRFTSPTGAPGTFGNYLLVLAQLFD
jgi:hypothetical protein